jgi:hypothetical protein
MRHPVLLAKELATLQNLSSGRLIAGAGIGWLAPEFAALGARFRECDRRMDEGIALRTERIADGWHGSRDTPEQTAAIVQRLRAERPGADFTISTRVNWDGRDLGVLRDRIAAYEAVRVQQCAGRLRPVAVSRD